MTPNNASPSAAKRRQRLTIAATLTVLVTAWAALQGDDPPSSSSIAKTGVASSARIVNTNARVEASNIAARPAPTSSAWPDAPLPDNRAPWPAASALGSAAWRGSSLPTALAPVSVAPKVAAAKTDLQPAPAQAPAFPYTLIGRIDDGASQAMLSGPTRSFGVRVNDVIDGQWRVDAVQAQSLSLTWLPGSIKKNVAFSLPPNAS